MASSDDEDDEEREPTLKYAKLTAGVGSIYRGGDSSSAFCVAGDKLIVGTHNGNIHTFALPTLHPLRSYRAHSSSITAISVSPLHQSLKPTVLEQNVRHASSSQSPSKPRARGAAEQGTTSKSPRRPLPAATQANSIHIASASLDGHVCVSSLVDDKDVTLRNYSRPVHAVALSPAFKNDRTYLSGGPAGELLLTVGGKVGASSDANTTGAVAAAAGWLGSMGLGPNTGRDTVLHSGEGTIAAIGWSETGRYVAWNNEFGTRIMHSHLEGADSETAWKRIGHVARPNRQIWQDMAGVWKAQMRWINTKYIEQDEPEDGHAGGSPKEGVSSPPSTPKRNGAAASPTPSQSRRRVERLLVGWGDTVWLVHINSTAPTPNWPTPPAKAEIVHQIRFDDGILCGVTLYTPSKLAALVFRTRDDDEKPIAAVGNGQRRKGRHNSLPPDLRLIDLASKEELETISVVVSRFEQLSFADYHLSSLFITPAPVASGMTRGALDMIGGGLSGLRDMSMGATRLFSSGASVLSGSSGGDRTTSVAPPSIRKSFEQETPKEAQVAFADSGLKMFIQSPFDCIVAIKRDLTDRLAWHVERQEYEQAWNLIKVHPEIITSSAASESRPSTPSKNGQSLVDFFDDETTSEDKMGALREQQLAVRREQQRIGHLWVEQLVASGDWSQAARVASKTLQDSSRWEHWITIFARNEKFDEITPYVPTEHMKPPLPTYVYEIILGHHVTHDRLQLQDLLDRWSVSLFDASSVLRHIEAYLETGAVGRDSVEGGIRGRDWKILQESLAKLYLADACPAEAIACYVRSKNADAALEVVREYAKIDAVADRIYDFVLLRVSSEKLARQDVRELDELTSQPVEMLAAASLQGTIEISEIVSQLRARLPLSRPFLFFYFRRLWKADSARGDEEETFFDSFAPRSRWARADAADAPGRLLLGPFADLVVSLFAEYSQRLLGHFLAVSEDYTFEHASDECRRRHYIPELVHLLSATGQTKSALHLIIDELGDVVKAIQFAKNIDEESLWGDLLDYGMDKPAFIRALLDEVGSAGGGLEPATLVRRIPEGLRVDGLKHSLMRLLRESEITFSISDGAARVLQGEIAAVMDELRRRRERGVTFDLTGQSTAKDCTICHATTIESRSLDDHLIGFLCGHVCHLSCMLDEREDESSKTAIENLREELAEANDGADVSYYSSRPKTAAKMRHARVIAAVLGDATCGYCGLPPDEADFGD